MTEYKIDQLRQAIFWTLAAEGKRADEIKFRLKRLFAADRALGRRPRSPNQSDRHYAFFSDEPPGTGVDILFTNYEAFASLAAITLLEHGLPQAAVVQLLRQVRPQLEPIHAANLRKNPKKLFDETALREQAKPGMIAFESTDPVILAFARLTGSLNDVNLRPVVCVNHLELGHFMKKHSLHGVCFSIFDFSRLIHDLAHNLSRTRAIKRGRARAGLPSP